MAIGESKRIELVLPNGIPAVLKVSITVDPKVLKMFNTFRTDVHVSDEEAGNAVSQLMVEVAERLDGLSIT